MLDKKRRSSMSKSHAQVTSKKRRIPPHQLRLPAKQASQHLCSLALSRSHLTPTCDLLTKTPESVILSYNRIAAVMAISNLRLVSSFLRCFASRDGGVKRHNGRQPTVGTGDTGWQKWVGNRRGTRHGRCEGEVKYFTPDGRDAFRKHGGRHTSLTSWSASATAVVVACRSDRASGHANNIC